MSPIASPVRNVIFRNLLVSTLFVLSLVASVSRAETEWTLESEHWYLLEMGGGTAGWTHEATYETDGQFRSVTTSTLRIGRGSNVVTVASESAFVETTDGRPVSLWFHTEQSAQVVETMWTFHDDRVESVARQGARELRKDLALPEGTWLTPVAAHRYWLARSAAGAERIAFRTILPDHGLEPIEVEQVRRGTEEVTIEGRSIPVSVWNVTTSALPGIVATTKFSADGFMISDAVSFPGLGEIRSRLVTRDEAMAAGAAPPPELMVRMFVESDPPIRGARNTVRARLRVTAREGTLEPFPTAGAQRVVESTDRSTLLEIDIEDNAPATPEELADPAYLDASTMIDPTDQLIVKLTRSACRDVGDDPHERADAMRAFVHRYISQKDLDTAFGTASEVARMKSGDCSEHGVILCAMLRADGIPARVATGLVYADRFAGERDIFGWHMWTQALIDGKWVDFDATLLRRYDAAHVLTATSALSEGSGVNELAAVVTMLGNLSIAVEDVDHR